MGANSKKKGSSGELELCKKLAAIYGGSWVRVPNSGAFTGGKNAIRKLTLSANQTRASKGDIVPPDFMPKLVLEAKWFADFLFHQLIQPGPCPQLDEWIGQALDAIDPGDLWFVAFKINRRGWFVAIPAAGADRYAFGNRAFYASPEHGDFIVCEAETFFATNRDVILDLAA